MICLQLYLQDEHLTFSFDEKKNEKKRRTQEIHMLLVLSFLIFANFTRWYAKRFLHPDVVAPYDYIFIWDEDLGVEHFDAEKYAPFPSFSNIKYQ